ncbi:hypothetical protein AVEN_114410-1 [Araneus ventricosus]|uniref:Uncharacterized protein n=1 Tax=Araneus ventricosus TaxID=182803 RepID=A0A4Y2S3V7_ARAVE|nr:hypothetical protein AVEN_114410-1 [Araneus ventricosus]
MLVREYHHNQRACSLTFLMTLSQKLPPAFFSFSGQQPRNGPPPRYSFSSIATNSRNRRKRVSKTEKWRPSQEKFRDGHRSFRCRRHPIKNNSFLTACSSLFSVKCTPNMLKIRPIYRRLDGQITIDEGKPGDLNYSNWTYFCDSRHPDWHGRISAGCTQVVSTTQNHPA